MGGIVIIYRIVKVNEKGQFTIPVYIRKTAKITKGDYVQFSVEENVIKIEKMKLAPELNPEEPEGNG